MTTGTFKASSSIPLVLLMMTTIFSTTPPVVGEPPSVVPSACKDAAAKAGNTFTEDFCQTLLQGKPSAGAADYADLALVAVDLTTANATSTKAKIDALLSADKDGNNIASLGLQSCRAAVKDGRYGDGKACLRRTAQAATACDMWFLQRKVTSPVATEDDDLAKLANLAIALASIA